MNCSGGHRHIGTAFSKVKSTNMDHWSEEQVNFMCTLGNAKANQFWEAKIPPDYPRPVEIDERHKFIANKYVRRLWIDPDAPVPYQYAPLFPGKPVASTNDAQVPIPAPSPSVSPTNVISPATSPIPSPSTSTQQPLFGSFPAPANAFKIPPTQATAFVQHPQTTPAPVLAQPMAVVDNSMPDLLNLGNQKPPAFDLAKEIFGNSSPSQSLTNITSSPPSFSSPPSGYPTSPVPYGLSPGVYGAPAGYGRGSPVQYGGYPPQQQLGYGYPPPQRPAGPSDDDLLDLGKKPAISVEQSSAILSMFEPQRGGAPPPAYGGYPYSNPNPNPTQNLFGPSARNPWG